MSDLFLKSKQWEIEARITDIRYTLYEVEMCLYVTRSKKNTTCCVRRIWSYVIQCAMFANLNFRLDRRMTRRKVV